MSKERISGPQDPKLRYPAPDPLKLPENLRRYMDVHPQWPHIQQFRLGMLEQIEVLPVELGVQLDDG